MSDESKREDFLEKEGSEKQGVSMSHILDAVDLTRPPAKFQTELEESLYDHCAKAAIHGLIHLYLEEGHFNELLAAWLLKELAKDTDRFDIEYKEMTGRKCVLAEMTLDAHRCLDVCFEDLSEEERERLKQESLKSIVKMEHEEAEEETLFEEIMSKGISLVEANKKYPHRPFLMSKLAQAMGEEGYKQLREIYPPLPGFPDPEKTAKWLAGEGPNPYNAKEDETHGSV